MSTGGSPCAARRGRGGEQELDDVVGALADVLEVGLAGEAEDLLRLALEHQRAARRGADDHGVARRGRGASLLRQPPRVAAGGVEHAVGLQRQPAAVLLGHVDREAVVREDARPSSRRVAARSSSPRSRGSRRPASWTPASGGACAQPWNVRPANIGIAASPVDADASSRSSSAERRLRSVQFAIGAAGVPRRPTTVGRAISCSRSGTPSRSRTRAFACVLISAMWTPCGHTWVQMPQLEQ